jgi:tRNA (cmo5U34)-methyltransferase
VGIDADADILAVAARRLGDRLTTIAGSFLRAPFPRADVMVASLALHHVRTRPAKLALYRRVRAALAPQGRLIVVDCLPAVDRGLRAAQQQAWVAHLRRSYSAAKAMGLLAAWSHEDVYVPLEVELRMLREAGLRAEVVWRKGPFAVMMAKALRAASAPPAPA